MVNVLFIDYKTLLEQDGMLKHSSVLALKMLVQKVDDIRIVCINNEQEASQFNYKGVLIELSQALNLKKSLFFDTLHVINYKELAGKAASWMSVNEVKSFALVASSITIKLVCELYPNNTVSCDEFSEAQAKDVLWIMSNFKTALAKDCSTVWFISDCHFSHKNIIKYCNRPWNHGKDADGSIIVTDEDVAEMDNEMIKRWNSVVGENDIVWNLGDFFFNGKSSAEKIFPQLNGKINLVMGNHDHWKMSWYYDLGMHRVYDRPVIINDFVILSHAPLMFLNDNTPFYNVFGHVHGSAAYPTWTKHSCCACVERHDYMPISWKTIKQKYDEMNNG